MNQSNLPARKATLAEVQEQFELWRKNHGRKKRYPIPFSGSSHFFFFPVFIFPVT